MNQQAARKIFIGGNWKCNGDKKFVEVHTKFLNEVDFDSDKCEVAVCPVYIHLEAVSNLLDKKYIVSSQNVSMFDNGAFTGEISAKQLKDIGINWTLIAHSERRLYFKEDEATIGEKIKKALAGGLNIILCVGERLEQREANETISVIENQMKTAGETVGDNWDRIVIAYEPVWAIGTGKTATPDQAQEVHDFIRQWIKKTISEEVSQKVRIIYGGSVTDGNCNDLIAKADIDGFLVGGASLKPAFKTIIESYKTKQ